MNIKELRNSLGLSQTEFGKRIGVDYHTVMRWEKGKKPSPMAQKVIEEIFGEKAK